MAAFQAQIFITSNKDLLNYARIKKTYLNLIDDGRNIISLRQLPNRSLKSRKRKKLAFILHIPSHGSNTVGHWCIALIQTTERILLFIDPLNMILKTDTQASAYLDRFCQKNGMSWINWDLDTQQIASNCCGLIVLYFLQFFSRHSLKDFGVLKKMLKNYSVAHREAVILKKVLQRFKKWFAEAQFSRKILEQFGICTYLELATITTSFWFSFQSSASVFHIVTGLFLDRQTDRHTDGRLKGLILL